MKIENDDRIEENNKTQNGGFVVNFRNDARTDDKETSFVTRKLSPLVVFLSNSKKNQFTKFEDGFRNPNFTKALIPFILRKNNGTNETNQKG